MLLADNLLYSVSNTIGITSLAREKRDFSVHINSDSYVGCSDSFNDSDINIHNNNL